MIVTFLPQIVLSQRSEDDSGISVDLTLPFCLSPFKPETPEFDRKLSEIPLDRRMFLCCASYTAEASLS